MITVIASPLCLEPARSHATPLLLWGQILTAAWEKGKVDTTNRLQYMDAKLYYLSHIVDCIKTAGVVQLVLL